jgi:hypothetical protein
MVWQKRQSEQSSDALASKYGELLWQAVGWRDPKIGAQGWNRVRIPVKADSWPTTFVISADRMSTASHFVGIDDISLVNQNGEEIGCGKFLIIYCTYLFC